MEILISCHSFLLFGIPFSAGGGSAAGSSVRGVPAGLRQRQKTIGTHYSSISARLGAIHTIRRAHSDGEVFRPKSASAICRTPLHRASPEGDVREAPRRIFAIALSLVRRRRLRSRRPVPRCSRPHQATAPIAESSLARRTREHLATPPGRRFPERDSTNGR